MKVPSLLFNEEDRKAWIPGIEKQMEGFPGITNGVIKTISQCDVELRKDLYGSIIFTGGYLKTAYVL